MAYANRGIARLLSNEELDKAIEDFKSGRDFFEGKDKERMLGFKEWVDARNAMNMKNWNSFRERMNEAKEYFDTINDPLSHSFDAFIKFSYLDEELDEALSSYDPIEASEKIETALKNLPEVEGLIDPERTIFGARILSFGILGEFISSIRGIDENTDLNIVKKKVTELLDSSKEVEEAFESVNFFKGKTAIVNIQEIISSFKQKIGKIEWAAKKKQEALEILKEYWSRLSPALKMMNGDLNLEIENIALRREIKSEMEVGFTKTKDAILEGVEKLSGEHKEILRETK